MNSWARMFLYVFFLTIIACNFNNGSTSGNENNESEIPQSLYDISDVFLEPNAYENITPELAMKYADPPKYPAWSFVPAKAVYHPGEMIYGSITVKNQDAKCKFVFTPPFRGALVDNTEIWFRPHGEQGNLERVSLFLKNLIGSGDELLRCGERIVLAPGEEYSILITVNSYFSDNTDRLSHVVSGAAVMSDPGEYEFYIRYMNWGFKGTIPIEGPNLPQKDTIYNWRTDQEVTQHPEGMDLRILPIDWKDVVVLGPFSVKIMPWPTQRENEMAKKIAAMWKRTLDTDHNRILFPQYDPELVKEALKVFPPSKEQPCSIGAMLKMHGWIARYPDFENIRYGEGLEQPLPEEERAKRLKEMLEELRVMKADEKPGVLRDLMCYWETRALIDLGEREEALKTAHANPTPDIMALIGRRIGLVLDPKWREIGPVRHLPPVEGITPKSGQPGVSQSNSVSSEITPRQEIGRRRDEEPPSPTAQMEKATPFPWHLLVIGAAVVIGALAAFAIIRSRKHHNP